MTGEARSRGPDRESGAGRSPRTWVERSHLDDPTRAERARRASMAAAKALLGGLRLSLTFLFPK